MKSKENSVVADRKVSMVRRRKKIWQIDSGHHCSVIGTCLSRRDLRQIASKRSYGIERGLNDFEIHRDLSAFAAHRFPKTRALHKKLDLKYRGPIKRYAEFSSNDEIYAQWKTDLASGDISGAYWAILTHPVCSSDLLGKVYGDCHMVSYDIFSSFSSDAKKQRGLRKEIESLQLTAEKNSSSYRKEREVVQSELRQLKLDTAELECQRKINSELTKENERLRLLLKVEKEKVEKNALHVQVEELKQENSRLVELVVGLKKEENCNLELLRLAEKTGEELHENVSRLEAEKQHLKEEIMSLEKMFTYGMSQQAECEDCEEKLFNGCRGIGLSGKTILYVGGRNNMVSHYREMVEKYGGVFLHHDGGKESSRNLLPRMLSGADAVLCPVDCVSHDACKCVKKICKRRSTPFVMMRSSGLSSLAKGLGAIVQ